MLHPPIPSPYANAGQTKVVYVSTHTPFISAVKRVRKLLEQAEKRRMGNTDLVNDKGSDLQKLQELSDKIESATKKKAEEIVMKGTSRAIEKVLSLGIYFQNQPECQVRIRTGTVGVVDDIVEKKSTSAPQKSQDAGEAAPHELPESRIRYVSSVEVGVSLR